MSVVVALFVTVAATLAFMIVLWRLEEGMWPPVGRWCWRLMGRCVRCGRRRERHPVCLHCLAGIYYNWHTCHACAKVQNFARLYGASPQMATRIFDRVHEQEGDEP